MENRPTPDPAGFVEELSHLPIRDDRPMLDQMEDFVIAAPSEEEFQAGLAWLQKEIYDRPERLTLLTQTMAPAMSHEDFLPRRHPA
jgi:hypothetical protein